MSTRKKVNRSGSSMRSVQSADIQGPMSGRPSIASVASTIIPKVAVQPRTNGNPNDLDIEITVANGSAWISKVSSNLEVKDQDGTVSDDSVRSSYVLSASTHQQLELNLTIPKTTSV